MRRLAWAAALSGLLAIAVACSIALYVRAELNRPFAGWSGEAVTIELERGASADTAVERLHRVGVIAKPRLVGLWLRWTGRAANLQAGEYRFDAPASPRAVIERILDGRVVLHAITVPEGLVIDEVAELFSASGLGDSNELRMAFGDPTPIRELDPDAVDLEGYLFPDTYRFAKDTPPSEIVAVMVERFSAMVGEDYERRARAVGLSAREAVTLASMIEKETSLSVERGRVSRVFHNRLASGMRMQCDPTVRYALHRAGREVGRLSRADLRFESPWNTYVSDGLPPGPICSPGAESLDAAVRPDSGAELYFVAAPDGGHVFSNTLEAHLRAVRVWRDYVRSSR